MFKDSNSLCIDRPKGRHAILSVILLSVIVASLSGKWT